MLGGAGIEKCMNLTTGELTVHQLSGSHYEQLMSRLLPGDSGEVHETCMHWIGRNEN